MVRPGHPKTMLILAIIGILALSACPKKKATAPTKSVAPPAASVAPSPSPSVNPIPAVLPNLPKDKARLEGKFRGAGGDYTFEPKCEKGVCTVSADWGKGYLIFKEKHGEYTATDHSTERCAQHGLSVNMPIDYEATIKVKKAQYIDDVWRATVIKIFEDWHAEQVQTSMTTATMIGTLTCGGESDHDKGTSFLQGHYDKS